MCCSRTKKWIIGLLLLIVTIGVIGYVVSMEDKGTQNKGTLVRAVKDEKDMMKEKIKEGSLFLCEKMNKAARKL